MPERGAGGRIARAWYRRLMATSTPSPAVLAQRSEGAQNRAALHAADEESIARWGAFYESLPAALREELDQLGHEIGAGAPTR
jgi:hypothetical protein